MVGGQNAAKALPPPGLLQKFIAQLPGGFLNGAPGFLRKGPDIAPAREKRKFTGGAPVPDEGLVPVRLRPPELVIEMGGGYPPSLLLSLPVRHFQQAH